MHTKIPHRKGLLCAAVSLSLLPLAGTSLAQDEATVEEVIVTGSYIRRTEGFTQASSVTQLTAEDLEAEGTMNLGEVVQNLSFVNGGASAITNTFQRSGADNRATYIDLRGLGARSTLTLLDGKRLVNQNVNALIPTIAIQRMDIVADGSAALYGNEAVAGVVNFVPYRSYEGLRIDTFAEQDSRGDYDEHAIQVLWGEQFGDLDIVLAGEFRQSGRLGYDERPVLANSGLTWSSTAPGNYWLPTRDENGDYTGDRIRAKDPNCGAERDYITPHQVASRYGFAHPDGVSCMFEYGDNHSYRNPIGANKFFANATWDVNDDLTLSVQGFSTRYSELSHGSTSNPGNQRVRELPTVRGEIPHNPFRAMNAMGQPLYAVDHNADGIPDRDPNKDLNGDGVADPILTANGGLTPWLPLYEDVGIRGIRILNKSMTQISAHSLDKDNLSDNVDHLHRITFQGDFNVPFLEGWQGMAAYTWNYREIDFMSNQNYDFDAIVQGLNCDVVNDRDGCYVPFYITDPSQGTYAHVLDAIAAREREQVKDTLGLVDIVFNGEVPLFGYELPGGPVAAAVGYQYRDDSYKNTPAAVEIRGAPYIGSSTPEDITQGNREVDAFFGELSVPVLDDLVLELAVRREEFSTGQTSTDPKYGITYAPLEWLTLRATQSEAFIAPTLEQLYSPETCGLSSVTDRFGPWDAFTSRCSGGNPFLNNESSESQQFGVDLVFDDWDLSVTWNQTDFGNRIVGAPGQLIMDIDFLNFQNWSGFTGTGEGASQQPSIDQLRSWLASGLADPRIVRDPEDILQILLVQTGSTNASQVSVTAYDIQGNYNFSLNDWGNLRLNLLATYIDEFTYQNNPTQNVRNAEGLYNIATDAAPALPELKANLRAVWTMGNHSVNATVHYVDSVEYKTESEDGDGNRTFVGGPTYGSSFGNPAVANSTHNVGPWITEAGIFAWTDMDIAYTYRGFEFWDGELAFTIGSRNVFDREAQRSPLFSGVIGQLQDPLGRMIYGRVVYDF